MLNRIAIGLVGFLLGLTCAFLLTNFINQKLRVGGPVIKLPIARPLDVYTIEGLGRVPYPAGKFSLGDTISEEERFISSAFRFEFAPNPEKQETKVVTGQINIPKGQPKAIVVMFRGYADQSIYETGLGTRKAAAVFANNGFITIAPDFLGYGGSDPQPEDVLEARFQSYTTALSLLSTIPTIQLTNQQFNQLPIFLWGHSNGGQIALTILEITQKAYPTALWAPVSKPFPYSVLYYTDESEDKGKFLRHQLADFEERYDADLYSLHKYYSRIKAPIQLHQGGADDAVPKAWSDSLSRTLLNLNLSLNYFTYPSADHNLRPVWNTVVTRDLTFFTKHLTGVDKAY